MGLFSRKEYTEDRPDYEISRPPVDRYHPDYRQGLNAGQVYAHKEGGWINVAVDPPAKTTREIIHDNIFTYFNLIFAVLAVLLIVVGSFRSLTFLPVIIINTMIGIVQEIRAKNTLEKLNMLNAPKASVVRDGRETIVDSESLVLDDVVVFRAGSQVCADAVVLAGEVQVNESLLTGESDEITKKKGDPLMSGSFIVAGKCHARLDAVGVDSYISRLTLEAKAMPTHEQSEMIRSLDRLVKFVGIALIPIGIALFAQGYLINHEGFRNSVVAMVAAVIGMIPEGLYLLASVALAVSSMKLAGKKVLLHDMKSIETLARVNVLCVDKTGTITENGMSVKDFIVLPGKKRKEGQEEKTGKTEEEAKEERRRDKKKLEKEVSGLMGDFVHAMSADNSTMKALKDFFTETGGRLPVHVVPFTSANKYSGAQFGETSYVLGAPEFVLREDYERYQAKITVHAKKGYRVLIFAEYKGDLDGKKLTEEAVPLAYVLLANPVRKEAPETFAYFAEQGVEVKVISGDNPLTVSEVAKEAGIPGAENYVDASALQTEKAVADAMRRYTVFGRVTPDQKRQFVQALQDQGKTVAMTGDGVNDVLALKDADCSVAMASGSDAAVQASQVVLLESDFSCMPSVVLEGRRVVNNIQRSASLFLVKNIFSFLLSLFSVAFMITYPLEPSQISLISMFTIGIPAFFLALQPNKEQIRGRFMTNVALKALPAALTDVLSVGALVVFGQTFGVDPEDISTAATILLAIVGFMILYKICQPLNVLRTLVWCGCLAGILVCGLVLPQLFAITGMSVKCIMLFVVFSIATEPLFRYLTKATELLEGAAKRWRKRKTRKE